MTDRQRAGGGSRAGRRWPSVRASLGKAISQLGVLLAVAVVGYLLASFYAGTLVALADNGHPVLRCELPLADEQADGPGATA